MLDLRAAYRAWASFRGAGPATRAFLLARLVNAPLGPLDADLRALRGRVLSLGAGYGLIERYLTELNPGVAVEGVELDASRVAVAAACPSPRVSVRNADVRDLPEAGAFSAVLAVDVLHHIALDDHGPILRALADRLEPGGLCLVKDIAVTPTWKHAWNRAHDRLVTGSGDVSCREPEDMARLLARAGFSVERVRRLSPASPYPHYLVRARRPLS